MPVKRKVSMMELVKEFFENIAVGYKCGLCGEQLYYLNGISKHWRTKHQHDTRIFVDK